MSGMAAVHLTISKAPHIGEARPAGRHHLIERSGDRTRAEPRPTIAGSTIRLEPGMRPRSDESACRRAPHGREDRRTGQRYPGAMPGPLLPSATHRRAADATPYVRRCCACGTSMCGISNPPVPFSDQWRPPRKLFAHSSGRERFAQESAPAICRTDGQPSFGFPISRFAKCLRMTCKIRARHADGRPQCTITILRDL